jgi:LacI family transcriptional regulator
VETRKRIQQKAKKMGYLPDPMLSALNAYRTQSRPQGYRGNLAWVTNYPEPKGWAQHEIFKSHYEGAKQRAEALGYRLEEFWLGEEKMSPKRAAQVLQARNIRGLLLCAQSRAGVEIQLDWARFAAVTFGYTLAKPALHTVSGHTFHAMGETIDQVLQLGYARPGLVLLSASDDRIFNIWSGAFLTRQQRLPKTQHVPIYLPEAFDERAFLRWVEKHKPDVVIGQNPDLIGILERAGYRVPQDIGFATPSLVTHARQPSGIDENSRQMGVAAVDMLVGMIHRNETGIPSIPYYLLIKGQWRSGKTLARRVGAKRSAS